MKRFIAIIMLLLVGFGSGAVWVTFNPLPVPLGDKGHRLFGVKDANALTAVEGILSQHGVTRRWAMSFGPTHQVVMEDNQTVLCWFDPNTIPQQQQNAISLVCEDPDKSADYATLDLRSHGFFAKVKHPPGTEGVPFCIVVTDALTNSVLAFRKHAFKMPRPNFE